MAAHYNNLLGVLKGASLNTTADQAIPIGASSYLVRHIFATNASATPTLAAGGIYSAASKGGTAVVGSGQLYTALSTAAAAPDLTLATPSTVLTAQTLYLSLSVANGSAATCDLYVFGDALS